MAPRIGYNEYGEKASTTWSDSVIGDTYTAGAVPNVGSSMSNLQITTPSALDYNSNTSGGLGNLWDNFKSGSDLGTGYAAGAVYQDGGNSYISKPYGFDTKMNEQQLGLYNQKAASLIDTSNLNGDDLTRAIASNKITSADNTALQINKDEMFKDTQSGGITGTDISQGIIGAGQLGLGYLGYKQNEKALDATIANNAANLAMAEDQLYYDKAKGETYKDATNRSVLSGFGSKA